ncbi:hypothetical protein J508_4168 [Acinetobacter sp. 1289694]|nr:hypothetical protein J508_4168 [Acinetobacter sp. 1289694]
MDLKTVIDTAPTLKKPRRTFTAEFKHQLIQQGVVSGNGKYSTLRIFTPTSFNDIQHGIFA